MGSIQNLASPSGEARILPTPEIKLDEKSKTNNLSRAAASDLIRRLIKKFYLLSR
jgi:hypothetical protein